MNWNSAVVGSNHAQMNSDRTKVTSDVHSAIQRAFCAISAGSRRGSMKMRATPTSGRNVVRVRIGKLLVMAGPSPDRLEEEPRHHDDGADQDSEGVVVDVTALQAPGAHGEIDRPRRDAVGTDAVDDGTVALFPEPAAEREGRADEEPVVELVEIPFVEKEKINRTEPLRDECRPVWAEHVEKIGDGDAGCRRDERQQGDDGRDVMDGLERVVIGEDEDRAAPERGALLANEELRGDPAGEDRAQREEDEGRQH